MLIKSCYGKWIDISDNKNTISINMFTINSNIYGKKEIITYKKRSYYYNSIRLDAKSSNYEFLVYHTEKINNEKVGIISLIVMEYDGRGPIVTNEFVNRKDLAKIPENFKSTIYHNLND